MLELKSRQSYILHRVIDTTGNTAVDNLLNELGIARRTLYYDIDKINDWLAQYSWGKVSIEGRNVTANLKSTESLEQKLAKSGSYFFSVEERRAMQIIYIALSSENVTINKLMDYFRVSKNTIIGDVKEIKQELKDFCLNLASTAKSGYIVVGEETAVRKMLCFQLQKLSSPAIMAIISNFLQNSLVALMGNDVDYFELCRCLIKQYEVDIGGDCFLPDIHMESVMIQVSWIRSRKNFIINMNSDEEAALMNTLSYRSVELSLQKLKVHDILISQKEIYYITSLFLGIQTIDFTTQEQENLYIYDLSERLISSFERVACLYFANRERLHKQLSHHIRPMYYRLKYGITIKNPLLKDIFRMYPLVSEFTRRALLDTDTELFKGIRQDELAYLSIYFASNLNEKYTQQPTFSTEDVLIIGPENMATAILVREQLEDLFGLSLRYNVISAGKLREWILDDYALVVSLTPASKSLKCKNLVEIGPILGEPEQKKIVEVLKQNKSISKYNNMIEEIILKAEKNLIGKLDTDKLYLDLLRYFNEQGREEPENIRIASDVFIEKINLGKLVTLPPKTSWEEAVLFGVNTLQNSLNNNRLEERMHNLLRHKKIQMYRVQSDVVLVHCPMQGDVDAKIDVKIFLSQQGVVCGDGKRAEIIILLSTINRYAHWDVLKDIYHYFDLQSHVDGVKQMCRKG